MSKLGLGTVQFGLDYGISNVEGRTPLGAVRRILAAASGGGVTVLDTASTYGESELILGQAGVAGEHFDIVTKTPVFSGARIDVKQVRLMGAALRQSLQRMGVERVAALLVHHASDLLKPGGERLFAAMQEAREAGLVARIGASVYTEAQIVALLERYPVQILQLPINVLDQRLIASGMLAELRRLGVEVHARSVFLQGLLLMDPGRLGPHFEAVRGRLCEFQRACGVRGWTVQQAALGFVRALPEVDVVLVGVNNETQLRDLLAVADTPVTIADWTCFAWADAAVLDPSRWPH